MKVADFGLARSVINSASSKNPGELEPPFCTDYVATRWYRAPEILVGSSSYSKQVDMWSMGCIFAEMLGGKPVFTGETTLAQMEKIIAVLGIPSSEEIVSFNSQFARSLIESIVPARCARPSRRRRRERRQGR